MLKIKPYSLARVDGYAWFLKQNPEYHIIENSRKSR